MREEEMISKRIKVDLLDVINKYRKKIGDKEFFERLEKIRKLPLGDIEELLPKCVEDMGFETAEEATEFLIKKESSEKGGEEKCGIK